MYNLVAPIVNQPWKHSVIDNVFLNESDWVKIVNASNILLPFLNDGDVAIPVEASAFLGVDRGTINIINKLGESFFNFKDTLFKNFDASVDCDNFSLHTRWGTIKNSWHEIHCDKIEKAFTFVVYVSPLSAEGTCLYSSDSKEDLVTKVEWKPNRGIMFVPKDELTWHNYYSYDTSPRITLLLCIYKN